MMSWPKQPTRRRSSRPCKSTVPEVVIADIRMPPTQTWEGLDVAREIRSEFPQIAILLLSAHAEVDTAIELLESGDGLGYLLKSRVADAADLLDAVERVCEGGSVIDTELVREVLKSPTEPIGWPS